MGQQLKEGLLGKLTPPRGEGAGHLKNTHGTVQKKHAEWKLPEGRASLGWISPVALGAQVLLEFGGQLRGYNKKITVALVGQPA